MSAIQLVSSYILSIITSEKHPGCFLYLDGCAFIECFVSLVIFLKC